MPTRNVVLTEHQAVLVERYLASGRYQNSSEVLREGLRFVKHQQDIAKAQLKALRDAAGVGIADIVAGRYRTFESSGELKGWVGALCVEVLSRKRRRNRHVRYEGDG